MNSKQITAIKFLTGKLDYLLSGATFNATQFDVDGVVYVSASDTSGFGESGYVMAAVGVRGGITIKEGSSFVRKMLTA